MLFHHSLMMSNPQCLNKSILLKLTMTCALSIGLIATSAHAAFVPGNQKPAPKTRRSDAGTTRGCSGGELPLTILASRNYIGRSTAQQPIFTWFVPRDSASKPMRFALYEWVPRGKPSFVREIALQSSAGVMKLSTDLALQAGKTYLWQVIVQCDPDNPSGDLVSEGNIEIVAMPADVKSKLDRARDGAERANIYAEAGLWYDAIAEALKLAETSKLGAVGSALINELAQSEASGAPVKDAKQIATLKQIATSER